MQKFYRIPDDERFLDSIIFNDGNMFHVSGKVKTHNYSIWGSENSRVSMENVRVSAKVFCTLSIVKVHGPFFT
jgi:hypothetical protein